ncbi:MAG: hypothetical protein EU548_03220, partial [Promethearchaeota archaeon]
MKLKPFNLETIRNLSSFIEEVEAKVNHIDNLRQVLINKISHRQKREENHEKENKIYTVATDLNSLTISLKSTSEGNLNKYYRFYNQLIKKYKEQYKSKLVKSHINKEKANSLGLFLIENKNVSKVISESSFIKSLNYTLWSDLIDSL